MKYRIRSMDSSPPGGFPFHQGGEKPRKFPAQPLAEAQGQIVASYRRGNGLPRASYAESLEDVLEYQCQRLNNDPRFCVECDTKTDGLPLAANAPGLKPCAGCGAVVDS